MDIFDDVKSKVLLAVSVLSGLYGLYALYGLVRTQSVTFQFKV